MDEIYGLQSKSEYSDKALMSPENLLLPVEYQRLLDSGTFRYRIPVFGSDNLLSAASALSEVEAVSNSPKIRQQEDASTLIKAKIAAHPYYPRLLEAYIDCQKVGAPPEIVTVLEDIQRENDLSKLDGASTCVEVDPSLDEFMETYCEMLVKYKSDLEGPFGEATSFLNEIEEQLSNLCNGPSVRSISDEGGGSSGDELSVGDMELQETQARGDNNSKDLKDRLFRRFGSHISSLKHEFSKKKKKGKLPREAKQILLEWWNLHCKWPYPTEADKISLAEATGLDPKQINNWFINQRKRHWKPTESMHFEAMENLSGRIVYS